MALTVALLTVSLMRVRPNANARVDRPLHQLPTDALAAKR